MTEADLTPFESSVLAACLALLAVHKFPSAELLREVGVVGNNYKVVMCRDRLVEAGLLVLNKPSRRVGKMPDDFMQLKRPRAHRGYPGPCHETIRLYHDAWRRIRRRKEKIHAEE